MLTENVIRAWKDKEFRNSLSEAEQAALPAHPSGITELDMPALDNVAAAYAPGPTACVCTSGAECFSLSACDLTLSVGDCGPLHPTP
jgi:mersacidin/lichenicidin family type 2 lantibiotic